MKLSTGLFYLTTLIGNCVHASAIVRNFANHTFAAGDSNQAFEVTEQTSGFKLFSAAWDVPHLSAPSSSDHGVYTWAAIDDGDTGTIFQAGLSSTVQNGVQKNDWFIAFGVGIIRVVFTTHRPTAGDTVQVDCQPTSSSSGQCTFWNWRTGFKATTSVSTDTKGHTLSSNNIGALIAAEVPSNLPLARWGTIHFQDFLVQQKTGDAYLVGFGSGAAGTRNIQINGRAYTNLQLGAQAGKATIQYVGP